jgi:hypothetical protein
MSINNGFWDLPAEDRGAAYDAAERDTGMSFFDLPAEERADYYDRYGNL